ncbi:MAG: hypothetical protein ABJC28_00910 [Acidobacteriota bacterium]
MIEYDNALTPSVKPRESEIGGRRIAVQAIPYSGEIGSPPFRFDPVERRFFERRAAGRVAVGPADPEAWGRALARCPGGPVVVGPGSAREVEEIRGAYAAAAEGAAKAGRPVYLLDPTALPADAGRAFVVLRAWSPSPDRGDGVSIAAARAAGLEAGGLLPIVPGWTDAPEFLAAYLDDLAAAGATFAAPIPASGDGEGRRILVEARAAFDPASADSFFEKAHHTDWAAGQDAIIGRFRAEAARRGLATFPTRPLGRGEPPGNSAAAARLEESAQDAGADEHRAALLYAAARWIDESGRDLAAVVSEGNFRKVFPFGSLAREAEAAFRESGAA